MLEDSFFEATELTKELISNNQTLKLLLWNTEGLRNALQLSPPDLTLNYDVVIMTETFLQEPLDLPSFYGVHAYAIATEGRPAGGVSCFLKPTAGRILEYKTEINAIIVKTTRLTLIGVYISPATATEDVIDTLLRTTSHAAGHTNVILAGDINCRTDKPSIKTDLVLETLEEEGFTLANEKTFRTYFAHNGASAIDQVFYRGKAIRIVKQEGLWASGASTIRKHIPVHTEIEIASQAAAAQQSPEQPPSRNLDLTKLQDTTCIEEAKVLIAQNKLDNAAQCVSRWISKAFVRRRKRHAQKWFDTECYITRKITLRSLFRAKCTNDRDDIEEYATRRREYKLLLKTKRTEHIEAEARETAELARTDPFLALRKRQAPKAREIPIETWVEHFSGILNNNGTATAYQVSPTNSIANDFTQITPDEIQTNITAAKKGRAAGPDKIFAEHIKKTQELLLPLWTDLFNKCLTTGVIPFSWRTSEMTILYKGKGHTEDPNSYRGIVLEPTIFKLFSKILTKRLAKEVDIFIPDCQFGFREKRSTLQAVALLQEEVEQALRHHKGKYHVVFIDYRKAFDLIDRNILLNKLKGMLGNSNPLVRIVEVILTYNYIILNDGVALSEKVRQTNGVLQGDPMSPLLFNILTADIMNTIQDYPTVKLIMYADDMALGSQCKSDLQAALQNLELWAGENSLVINKEKTVHMIFRKGGKLASDDHLTLQGDMLTIVTKFRYLGVYLQTTLSSYRMHIQERASAATKAIHRIKNISKLSLPTAMTLFKAVIAPIASYGIELIWEKLTNSDLTRLESVKARYLKRVLGVGIYAHSRIVYELARESFFIEDLRQQFMLPSTGPYQAHLDLRRRKRDDIDLDFYSTSAMMDRQWTEAGQDQRHVVTRLATHGFHHKICRTQGFHQPRDDCVCSLCNRKCDRYHLISCVKRTKSIRDYSEN